uniref:Uncharacterized protein n=1 Tax=Nelumbo nucifera TaxID=4432 RepID=A0A822Y992_NELNU|nr:TPA_asm: hypothetical protein HUJ06_030300 [Nelumbo nucifera]
MAIVIIQHYNVWFIVHLKENKRNVAALRWSVGIVRLAASQTNYRYIQILFSFSFWIDFSWCVVGGKYNIYSHGTAA